MSIARQLQKNLINEWDSGKILILIGPRQVGKTTLLTEMCQATGPYVFINGDDPEDRRLLEDAGETKLKSLIGNNKTVFFDEAQRIQNIGITLKIIHDRIKDTRVVVSGSSAFELTQNTNEPLTGRKWEYQLLPFSWQELSEHFGAFQNEKNLHNYLVYGMYPDVVTHPDKAETTLKQLAGSYLYKDILEYGGIRKPEVLDKLLLALALQLGNEVNYNELSQTVGADRATVEQYIALLEQTFVLFRLPPLSRNVRNEINTSRKIYFYDNGIRNAIIGNFSDPALRQDIGALWENFAIAERIKVQRYNNIHSRNFFWRTYQQQEIDWIEERNGAFTAVEFKWNVKKSNIKFSNTFTSNYPVHKTLVVTPKNLDTFLSTEF